MFHTVSVRYITDVVLQDRDMNLVLRKRSNGGFIFIQLLLGIADFLLRWSRIIKQAQTKCFDIFVPSGMMQLLQNYRSCCKNERMSLQGVVDSKTPPLLHSR